MDAIAIGRAAAPKNIGAKWGRAIVALLRAALERLPATRSDVPPEFFRYPFP